LIERLARLGAPVEEARRIIETAQRDPLIASGRAMTLVLRRRDWLLDALERQQRLWPGAAAIERRRKLRAEEFLEVYYARARPVILVGEMYPWAAVHKWTPPYLASIVGSFEIVCRSQPTGDGRGVASAKAEQRLPFDRFIAKAAEPEGPDRIFML